MQGHLPCSLEVRVRVSVRIRIRFRVRVRVRHVTLLSSGFCNPHATNPQTLNVTLIFGGFYT